MDLYYLMDLSKSMEDDKEKLSALGDLLAETMQNLTSNFRFPIVNLYIAQEVKLYSYFCIIFLSLDPIILSPFPISFDS